MLLTLTVLTGLIYPLLITALAQTVSPDRANGSLLRLGGRTVGSRLIGQEFTGPEYFHGRPSAKAYDAGNSGGSNLGPSSAALITGTTGTISRYRTENGLPTGQPVPGDAVLASGSGLDPHITPENAFLQVKRVALARHLSEKRIDDLVKMHLQGPTFGFLGQSRICVLDLNIALDQLMSDDKP